VLLDDALLELEVVLPLALEDDDVLLLELGAPPAPPPPLLDELDASPPVPELLLDELAALPPVPPELDVRPVHPLLLDDDEDVPTGVPTVPAAHPATPTVATTHAAPPIRATCPSPSPVCERIIERYPTHAAPKRRTALPRRAKSAARGSRRQGALTLRLPLRPRR
jgi:hypothetical protein